MRDNRTTPRTLVVLLALSCSGLPLAGCSRSPGSTVGAAAGQRVAQGEAPPSPFHAVVTHVDDGDTFNVRAEGGRSYRVRLAGVDAPEVDQSFGTESRNRLRTLVFGQSIDVRPTGVDQYGRLLACPTVDGRNLCETLVDEGWVWHYRQHSNDARLAELERQARAARRGLWNDPAARPPWEHRAAQRQRGAAGGSGRAPGAASPAAAGPFHGNVRSRIYHAPGCESYDCASCTAVFSAREAAEAAGYRPHRECVR